MFSEVVQETKTRHETFDSSKIFDLLTEVRNLSQLGGILRNTQYIHM